MVTGKIKITQAQKLAKRCPKVGGNSQDAVSRTATVCYLKLERFWNFFWVVFLAESTGGGGNRYLVSRVEAFDPDPGQKRRNWGGVDDASSRWYPCEMPHPVGSGLLSFGLVSIPVRLYSAISEHGPSFHFLHAKCGSRVRTQRFCPACNKVVEREELIRGYEYAKGEYVRFTDEELAVLELEVVTYV